MRNLKKFLALVLAMVMAFSLMLSASAANFDDKHFSDTEEVTQAFKEAVAVLTGLNVIKGDGDGEIKDIRPQDTITRAEAAALVYRIATGDINDTQKDLYKDYGHFNDVNSEDWFAGYVGYCQNAGYIKGTTPTTFNPYGKVTGYEVLAMILRVVGYGKNNEFTGSSWQVEVASLGKTKHITDSVSSDQYGYTLNQPARREIVAELLFRGSLIPTVTWSSALGYNEFQSVISVDGTRRYNRNLASNVFGLYRYGWRYGDDFGRPELVWKASLNPTSTTPREVAVLAADWTEAFHETKRECDIAELMEFGTAASKDYVLFVNNDERVTDTYHVVATDTVTKVGGMGRQVEIYTEKAMNEQYPYHDWYSYWNTTDGKDVGLTAPKDTIVMVDTIVAKVLNKTDAVLDAAGHVITPAKLTVDLYDDDVNKPTRRTIQKPATSKDNWEFAIGDVLCMNGISDTQGTANATTGVVSGDESHAFRTAKLTKWSATNNRESSALVENTDVFEITKMTGTSGKQTLIYKNVDKHQVDGTDKDDDLTLKLDKAGDNVNTTYIWYYDQYGYVQAIDEGSANYGVITSVYAAFGQGETQTNGTAKAVATVKFSDGTTGTVEIDRFLLKGNTPENGGVATTAMKDRLVVESDNSHGATTMELWPVYDINTMDPMKTTDMATAGLNIAPINSNVNGFVYMAPAAVSNTNGHNKTTPATTDKHGILFDNLFKFVKTANDQMVAVEVAGNGDNTGLFDNNFGDYTSDAGTNGRLIKNLSMVSGKDDSTDPKVWIDNETKILVRDITTNSIAFYDGVSALPGDVKIDKSTTANAPISHYTNEIDWADTDEDGRAEVLYITGKIDGQTTYGLFFYNGGAASWDGTKGTLEGFLNGEQKTLTFTKYADYNSIVTSSTAYKGHLFAVQQIQGVVTNVMEKNEAMGATAAISTTNLWTNRLLAEEVTSATPHTWNSGKSGYATTADLTNVYLTDGSATTHLVAATDKFQLGGTPATAMNGNPYTADTRAVYWTDTGANIQWVPEVIGSTGTIEVRNSDTTGDGIIDARDSVSFTYYVNPGTKVWGLGHGVVSGESALEYLNKNWTNDVTIVYNTTTGSNFAALEVYVSTDPDITDTSGNSGALTFLNATSLDSVLDPAVIYGPRAAKDLFVKSQPDGVYKASYDLSLAGDIGAATATTLYFKFSSAVPDCGNATLIITKTDGTTVFTSNALNCTTAATVNHYFYVNFNGLAASSDGTGTDVWAAPATRLPSGTYYYTITSTASSINSSGAFGSFTIN